MQGDQYDGRTWRLPKTEHRQRTDGCQQHDDPAGSEHDCCVGWTVSGARSQVGANIYSAMAFTPNANYAVARIDLAAGYVSGSNGVVITLNDDQGGVPGNIIHTWRLTNIPTFGTCCTLESVPGAPQAVITGGVQYWIVERALLRDTWDAWNYNDTGATGTAVCIRRATATGGPGFRRRTWAWEFLVGWAGASVSE